MRYNFVIIIIIIIINHLFRLLFCKNVYLMHEFEVVKIRCFCFEVKHSTFCTKTYRISLDLINWERCFTTRTSFVITGIFTYNIYHKWNKYMRTRSHIIQCAQRIRDHAQVDKIHTNGQGTKYSDATFVRSSISIPIFVFLPALCRQIDH